MRKRKDKVLAILLTQVDLLAINIKKLEVPRQKKDRYITPHEPTKSKECEGGKVEEMPLTLTKSKNTTEC